MQVLRKLENDVYMKNEFKKYASCNEAEQLNIVVLTFWRRNYFFNFSTLCI